MTKKNGSAVLTAATQIEKETPNSSAGLVNGGFQYDDQHSIILDPRTLNGDAHGKC